MRFVCSVNDDKYKEIMTYNQIMDHIDVMIIYKALYGLCSSGECWHDRFSDCLSAEGFFPCKAEPDT
jgi:hypothetical protein